MTYHDGNLWGGWRPGLQLGVLPAEAVTLAELLQKGGYNTGAFVANPLMAPKYGFNQGFDVYEMYEVYDLSRVLMDAATNWFESLSEEQPFFAYLHFMDVHGPYESPEADYEALKGSPSLGGDKTLEEFLVGFGVLGQGGTGHGQ